MTAAWNAFPMLDRLLDDVMTGVAGTSFGATAPASATAASADTAPATPAAPAQEA